MLEEPSALLSPGALQVKGGVRKPRLETQAGPEREELRLCDEELGFYFESCGASGKVLTRKLTTHRTALSTGLEDCKEVSAP